MNNLDSVVTHAINSFVGGNAAIDTLMIWASTIGVPLLVLAVMGQWLVQNQRVHTRHILIATGLSFITGLALNQFLILFIHRLRPYDVGLTHLLVPPSPDFSFPSDHATASFAIVAGFLLHGFWRRSLGFLVPAFLIAFSRVYIGTHYIGDVIGGATTALLAAVLVRLFYREGSRLDNMLTRIW